MRGKNFITAVTVVAGCLLLSMNSFAAEHLGTIAKVTDTVISEGDHGKIVTEITGTTDGEGLLALPLYEDAKLVSVTAAEGTLERDLEEQETGMTRYLVARFAEPGKEVELNLVWDQEDTYKRKAAKTKGTAPGDLEVIRYDMVNTSPVTNCILRYRRGMSWQPLLVMIPRRSLISAAGMDINSAPIILER